MIRDLEKFCNDFKNLDEVFSRSRRRQKVHVKTYLQALNHMSKLVLSSDGKIKALKNAIAKSFEELSEIQAVEPILQLVSFSPDLTKVFNFNEKNSVAGVTSVENSYIYIDASGLTRKKRLSEEINQARRCKFLGILAHELCHFAIGLMYDNECKPFKKNEVERQNKFDEIVEISANRKNENRYIKNVFEFYPRKQWSAELIVQVSHMMVLYSKTNNDLEKFRQSFNELFQFYEESIIYDMKQKYATMSAKKEVQMLNEFIGAFSRLKCDNSFHKP